MLRKFFCFDLYTTGLLIGWLGLAESITSCIFSILMLENVDSMIQPKDFPEIDDIVKFKSMISTLLALYIAFNIIDLLASGLLIAGTVKRNRLLVIPWLINSFISLLFNGIAIALTLYVSVSSKSPDWESIVPFSIAAIVIFGIYVYAYFAIGSLYQHIRQNTSNNEYSSLIGNQAGGIYPTYTRC